MAENDATAGQETVIAALCAEAPNDNIRNCLRKYEPKKPTWQIEKAFKSFKKDVLVETLDYLGVPEMDQYLASILPHELICRIQNLFPDKCDICKKGYCVKLDENPIVSCVVCWQGYHNS